ncbi:MAG: prephenate dehydrogenase [Acholeplasmatales bacterium]|nr:prephenate dehydrogenase [Acholeplasmatales bacterium]
MKVLIVGLGLIGGAYAKKLTELGYEVYGVNHRQKAIDFAVENNYIIEGSTDARKYIPLVDMIIIATYPSHIINFLNENKDMFRDDLLITDVTGVKSNYIVEATKLSKPATYLAHHPMAGREKKGIEYASEVSFNNANFIITPVNGFNYKEKYFDILKKLGSDLKFKNISILDSDSHDFMIGYTSQLAHAIAVSLVNSDTKENTKLFIGDSYRDLTRIAMINEVMWSELFFENKKYLLENINNFMSQLNKLKETLENNNPDGLKELFINSTKIRKEMEK